MIIGFLGRHGFGVMASLALAGALATSTANAQTVPDSVAACSQTADPATAVSGCTKLLDGGQLNAAMRAAVHQLRGAAHQTEGRLADALRDFVEANRIDPDEPAAAAGLKLVLDDLAARCSDGAGQGTSTEACRVIIENAGLAAIPPAQVARAHLQHGIALERERRIAEAAKAFRAALQSREHLSADQIRRAEAGLASLGPAAPTATVVIGAQALPATTGGEAEPAEAVGKAEIADVAAPSAAREAVAAGPPEAHPKRPARLSIRAKRAAAVCGRGRASVRASRFAWAKGGAYQR